MESASNGESRLAVLPCDTMRRILAIPDVQEMAFVVELVCKDLHSEIKQIKKCHYDVFKTEFKTPIRAVISSVTRLEFVRMYPPEYQPEWLRKWDKFTCAMIASEGHLEIVQWVRNQPIPCEWGTSTCTNAAMNGDLSMLKWLRENHCPFDSLTCAAAAETGNLEVLKWLRKNGCHWDALTLCMARKCGKKESLEWIVANGCGDRYHAAQE